MKLNPVVAGAIASIVTLTGSLALAGVTVTQATVNHSFVWDIGPDHPSGDTVNTTPLNAASPGNNYTTLHSNTVAAADGKLGVTSTLGSNGGTFRADAPITAASAPSPSFQPYHSSTTGSMNFTVAGGTLSLSADNTSFGVGSGTITNLTTSQFWKVTLGPSTPTISGNLSPTAAPAGNYQLTWDVSGYRQAGTATQGVLALNLAVTPEPATATAVLGLGGLVARRRRR